MQILIAELQVPVPAPHSTPAYRARADGDRKRLKVRNREHSTLQWRLSVALRWTERTDTSCQTQTEKRRTDTTLPRDHFRFPKSQDHRRPRIPLEARFESQASELSDMQAQFWELRFQRLF